MTDSGAAHLRAVDTAGSEAEPELAGITPPGRRGGSSRFLTDVLIELGYCDAKRVEGAIDEARSSGMAPERLLLDQHAITGEQLSRAIAERYGLDHLDLGLFKVDMAAVNLLTSSVAKRYNAVPVAYLDEHTLLLAMSDPANVLAVDDIAMLTRLDVRAAVASEEDIQNLIGRMNRYEDAVQEAVLEGEDEAGSLEVVDLRESADDAPVIKLVHSIIADAAERGASDIHFEPQPDEKGRGGAEMKVRMRIDGVLTDQMTVPKRMISGVISRIKIMGNLDISERRIPQDGRVGLTVEGRHVDIRVVTLPSVVGESSVLRILDKDNVRLKLESLGMQEHEFVRFRKSFNKAHGAVLVTGPTGSGKSTTLYAALGELNTPERGIITIEDPGEYQIEGITQIQINPKAGLTFATGLRSMMRADPDVLMVGEIRDRETAQIAIEGALTGHMVLSTLHTNDAPAAITRLIEMGIEPFLLASAIDGVVAQRLARTLCTHCKRRTIITADVLRDHGFHAHYDIEAYEPVGCVRCAGMGYRGRVGLYEVMIMSDEIRTLTLERAAAEQIAVVAMKEGMRRMREDGLEKVKSGVTTMSEVSRVTGA
ncbi:MAG: Flp pilus assembly complex ATPase component TadA [Solirubrobacterales bacterium]|nr:Flp pilus assembly complex ATPase component TadA [Solirubrobacterales bacterium]